MSVWALQTPTQSSPSGTGITIRCHHSASACPYPYHGLASFSHRTNLNLKHGSNIIRPNLRQHRAGNTALAQLTSPKTCACYRRRRAYSAATPLLAYGQARLKSFPTTPPSIGHASNRNADSELRSPLSAEPQLFNSAYPQLQITNPRLPTVGYVDGCLADVGAATTSRRSQWLKSLP